MDENTSAHIIIGNASETNFRIKIVFLESNNFKITLKDLRVKNLEITRRKVRQELKTRWDKEGSCIIGRKRHEDERW